MSAFRHVNARALVVIVASAAFAVSGCTGSADQPPAPTTSSTADKPAPTTDPTSTPVPNSTPVPTDTPSSTPATAEPEFPPAVAPAELQHGSTYWGVYVTVVRTDNYQIKPEDQKRLDAGKKSLTDLGYEADSGAFDSGCEMGMQEQLHLDPQRIYAAVRIFFTTQAQAQQFVDAYQPGIVGTAKVTLYCMD